MKNTHLTHQKTNKGRIFHIFIKGVTRLPDFLARSSPGAPRRVPKWEEGCRSISRGLISMLVTLWNSTNKEEKRKIIFDYS